MMFREWRAARTAVRVSGPVNLAFIRVKNQRNIEAGACITWFKLLEFKATGTAFPMERRLFIRADRRVGLIVAIGRDLLKVASSIGASMGGALVVVGFISSIVVGVGIEIMGVGGITTAAST